MRGLFLRVSPVGFHTKLKCSMAVYSAGCERGRGAAKVPKRRKKKLNYSPKNALSSHCTGLQYLQEALMLPFCFLQTTTS